MRRRGELAQLRTVAMIRAMQVRREEVILAGTVARAELAKGRLEEAEQRLDSNLSQWLGAVQDRMDLTLSPLWSRAVLESREQADHCAAAWELAQSSRDAQRKTLAQACGRREAVDASERRAARAEERWREERDLATIEDRFLSLWSGR